MSFGRLEDLARALDGQLGLDFRWRGEALDRLIDERHAALVDRVVRLLVAAGWEVDVEVTFSIYGERGSIDVFARHLATSLVLVIEVKASIGEAGATLIGLDRKVRLAPAICRERGWACRGVAKVLVVPDGTSARRRIARHEAAFRGALPTGSRAVRAWIKRPAMPAVAGILFLKSPNVRSTDHQRG